LNLLKKFASILMSNRAETTDLHNQTATYERNLEIIREFSQNAKSSNLTVSTANFWSEALSVSTLGENIEPNLAVRRIIRHVASLLDVVPQNLNDKEKMSLVDLVEEARGQLKKTSNIDTGFDALEHRIKQLKNTLG